MRCLELSGPAPAMASYRYATLDDLDMNSREVVEDVEFSEVVPAVSAMRTSNKIREIVENLTSSKTSNEEGKEVISLSIGDPTTYGNLAVSEQARRAVADAVMSGLANGYAPSTVSITPQSSDPSETLPPKIQSLMISVGSQDRQRSSGKVLHRPEERSSCRT
mmetsp:Transcript_23141/g.92513  ORF Transcript_23141/g.92513 Transcript_23141/m.92513 type:complete len:163 (+) Transcript_23141:217-705(+)